MASFHEQWMSAHDELAQVQNEDVRRTLRAFLSDARELLAEAEGAREERPLAASRLGFQAGALIRSVRKHALLCGGVKVW